MKTFNLRTTLWGWMLGALLLVGQSAQAGYITPSFSGLPNSTSSTWNYNGDWSTGSSASHLTSFTSVPGGYPLTTDSGGCAPGIPCLTVSPGPGNVLFFFIPNFVDPLGLKLLVIQYIFERSALPDPGVTIVGSDPTGPVLALQQLVTFQTDDFLTFGAFQTYGLQAWTLQPNPDWEAITITGAVGATLREVKIDTISIPEPATLLLVSVAILGLGFSRRRA